MGTWSLGGTISIRATISGLNKALILCELSSWSNLRLRVASSDLIRAFPGLGRALILLSLLLAVSFFFPLHLLPNSPQTTTHLKQVLELANQKTKTKMPTAVMTLEQVMEKRRERMQNYCKISG